MDFLGPETAEQTIVVKPSDKRLGEVSREGNILHITDPETFDRYQVNIDKIKGSNKAFVLDVERKPPQNRRGQKIYSTFKVLFRLEKKQIVASSLEFVDEEILTLDKLLKNVPQKRETGTEFSKTTDLAEGKELCTKSTAESVTAKKEPPKGAKPVTIQDILKQATAGIEEQIKKIKKDVADRKLITCPACGKPEHSDAEPLSFTTWYYLDETDGKGGLSMRAKHRFDELQKVLDVMSYCSCGLKAVPRAPVNVFRRVKPAEKKQIDNLYEGEYAKKLRSTVFPEMKTDIVEKSKKLDELSKKMAEGKQPFYDVLPAIKDKQRINHIVPRSGGGCPTKTYDIVKEYGGEQVPPANLIPIWAMCPLCQMLDELFTKWQDEQQHASHDEFVEKVIRKDTGK